MHVCDKASRNNLSRLYNYQQLNLTRRRLWNLYILPAEKHLLSRLHMFFMSKLIKGLKAIKHFSVCVNKIRKAPDCPTPVSHINYGPLSDDAGDTWNKCSESVCLSPAANCWIEYFHSIFIRFLYAFIRLSWQRNRHWNTFLLYLEKCFKSGLTLIQVTPN